MCAGLLCWGYWLGHSRATDRCKAQEARELQHLVKRIQEEQATNARKDAEIQRLLSVKPGSKVREVMREVHVDCELPAAVHDSLQQAVADANKPAG